MGARDHSYECEECGEQRGGLNDEPCACDRLCGRCYQETCICEPGVCICNAYMAGECCCGAWDEPLDSEVTARRLACLALNLAWAATLCHSWRLGRDSCTCDQGPVGHEWHPGIGCTPESIADREWMTEPHAFNGPDSELCTGCNERVDYYLHTQCPECYADLDGNETHAPGCRKERP